MEVGAYENRGPPKQVLQIVGFPDNKDPNKVPPNLRRFPDNKDPNKVPRKISETLKLTEESKTKAESESTGEGWVLCPEEAAAPRDT